MSLLDRLLNDSPDGDNLPVHEFMAALAEYRRGSVTSSQVVNAFDLDSGEANALQEFLDNLNADTIDRAKIHDVLLLGAADLYTKAKVKTELGLTSN